MRLYGVILLVILQGCATKAPSISTQQHSEKQMQEHMKFDIETFWKRVKDHQEEQSKLYNITFTSDGGDVEYIGDNGNHFRDFGDREDGYVQNETESNGIYQFYREFDQKGNLIARGTVAKFGGASANLGVWEKWDENGKLTESVDYEKGYKVSYQDVLKICKEKNIDLAKRLSRLSRAWPKDEPLWYIRWDSGKYEDLKPEPGEEDECEGPYSVIYGITIDGVTGEIKKAKKSYHLDN